jgi:putative nucleotidyltransferase with HDIG domain
MKTIENLALATETFRVFTPSSRIPDSVCESLQQHAHRTAAIAGALPVDRKSRDVAVVAALLHDVGRLILASKMPDLFCTLSARANERHCELFEAEEEMIGVSHAEIGAYLLGLWGISNLAVEAIAHHHHPTRISHSGFDISVTVYVADLLDRELETHPNDSTGSELKDSDRTCLQTLGIFPRFAEFRDLAKESAN